MEANVKPGTRCGCRLYEGGTFSREHADAHRVRTRCQSHCEREAVRMVLVPKKDQSLAYHGEIAVERIPMCEACASFYESRSAEHRTA